MPACLLQYRASAGRKRRAAVDPSFISAYNHPGVAITASSGDSGYTPVTDGGEEVPAAFPTVISVGGTSLLRTVNRRGWNEIVWPYSGSGGADNGFVYVPMPLWQTETGCGPARIANDVAAVADPQTGVAVYDSYPFDGYRGWVVVAGHRQRVCARRAAGRGHGTPSAPARCCRPHARDRRGDLRLDL
jgi:hypothetical protein